MKCNVDSTHKQFTVGDGGKLCMLSYMLNDNSIDDITKDRV